MIIRQPNRKCPACGKVIDADTPASFETVAPQPDDFSICLFCSAWCRYNNDMTLRLAEEKDMEEMQPDQIELLSKLSRCIEERNKQKTGW
jgi:hypothetical protein